METLRKKDAPKEPFELFELWYRATLDRAAKESAAREFGGEPTAFSLATADSSGRPAVRVILLKSYDENGFVFYTNYDSEKGAQLAANPHAELNFYWGSFARQVRVSGRVEKVTAEESDRYFASRDRASQVGAWASRQSQVLDDRGVLEDRAAEIERRFKDSEQVPRPPRWGGFLLIPEWFEFWQSRPNRLHDRLRYRRRGPSADDGWLIERLSP